MGRALTVLVRRRWLIAVAALAAVAVALLVTVASTKVYAATARLVVDAPAATSAAPSDASDVATHIQILKSHATALAVSQQLGQRAPLVSAIHIKRVGSSRVVAVTAESTEPAVAHDAASTYARVYVDQWRNSIIDTRQKLSQTLQQKMQETKKHLDDLDARISAAVAGKGDVASLPSLRAERDSASAQYNDYKARYDASLVDTGSANAGVRVVQDASAPGGPVKPRPLRNVLVGLVLGLIVGVIGAFVFEGADDGVRNADDIARAAPGKRILGIIPSVRSWRDRDKARLVTAEDPAAPASEAYRSLRTNVQFALARQVGHSMRTVLVTSATGAEGKSATVANLAIALARAGRRVICVDCDLRRPRLHKFFGLEDAVGFTSVLLGDSPLSASLQQVSVSGGGSLRLLASGPLPPNPAELLETSRVSELLGAVEADADVVLIDAPPVLPVTDALSLAARVDGVLLATALHITSRRAVTKAMTALADADTTVLGIVLNGAAPVGGDNEPARAPAATREERVPEPR